MGKKRAKIVEENGCLVRIVHLDRVAKARAKAVNEKDLANLALFYKALGDLTRLTIITSLRHGEMCVCDLAAYMHLSESAVSHQLRRLKDLGLIKNRRDGQVLYYSLADDHVAEIIRMGLEHIRE
jgi:DNA-binding transcriptional ArsR family regulator